MDGMNFQKQLDKLKKENRWYELRAYLESMSKQYPHEYFIWTELAGVYYVLNMPKEAEKAGKKAYTEAPDDYLVLYNYGMSLYLNKKYEKALRIIDEIVNADIQDIAYGPHGEGMRWGYSLHNDSLYMKGVILKSLGNYDAALSCMEIHLKRRRRGFYSDFTKKQVEKNVERLHELRS